MPGKWLPVGGKCFSLFSWARLEAKKSCRKSVENPSKIFLAGWPFSKSSISFKRKHYQKNVMIVILGREAGGGISPVCGIHFGGLGAPSSSSFWIGWYQNFAPASGITIPLVSWNVSVEPFLESQDVPTQLPPFFPPFFLLIFLTASRKKQHLGEKSTDLAWIWVWTLLLTLWVTLDKLLNFSGPQFPHL